MNPAPAIGLRPSPENGALTPLLAATVLLILLFVPAYLFTMTGGTGIPRDGTSLVVGRDFLNIWMYGRAAWEGDPARYYDIPTYLRAVGDHVGAGYPGQLWSYPPHAMLVAAPFGLLPYLPALLLWTLAGQGALIAALRLWTRDARLILIAAASPAALFGIMSGQFACFAAAIILAVLRWRESRPLLAGALLGLLTIKPQLGLLFPVLLLASRNWRAIGAAVASTLTLAAVTALLWGPDIWRAYVFAGIANQSLVLSDPDHLAGPFMPTLFMNLRVAGVPVAWASALQSGLALLALALVFWRFRDRPEPQDGNANTLFLAAMVCATPYMLAYDTLALAAMTVLMLAGARGSEQGRILPMLIIFLPLVQMVAGTMGMPGPALLPPLFALSLARRKNRVGELNFRIVRP